MPLYWISIIIAIQIVLFVWLKLEGVWELAAFIGSVFLLFLVPAIRERSQLRRGLSAIFSLKFTFITLLLVIVVTIGATTLLWPTYLVIGDEFEFYGVARALVHATRTFHNLAEIGVYGTHPLGWSVYQSIFLRVFGDSFWMCRFSSMLWHYMAVFPIFVFVQMQCGQRAAWISATLFCSSYYGFQFSHMAYNNLAYLTPLLFSLMFAQIGLKKHSEVSLLLAGLFATLGFYLNYMSFLTPWLVLLFLVLNSRAVSSTFLMKRALQLFISGALVGALPFLSELPTHISTAIMHFNISSHPDPNQFRFSFFSPFPERFRNFLMTLGAPLTFNAGSHHVHGRIIDLPSALLAMFGLIALTYRALRGRTADGFFFITIFIFCYAFGFLIPYNTPSVTRLMFWIPMVAILAGAGSSILLARIPQVLAHSCVVIALPIMVVLNIQHVLEYKERVRPEHTLLKGLIVLLQPTTDRYIFLSDQNPATNDIYWVEAVYGLTERLIPVSSEKPILEVLAKFQSSGAKGIIIVPPKSDRSNKIAQELLTQLPDSILSSVPPSIENPDYLLIHAPKR